MDSNNSILNRKVIDKRIYIPYGLEIEAENISFDLGKRLFEHKVNEEWTIGTDRSLMNCGLELSSPVLPNNKEPIIKLKKIAKTLSFLKPTFEHASLQLNFSVSEEMQSSIVPLLKMFYVYQDIIYRFSTGVDDKLRSIVDICAFPLLIKDRLTRVDEILINNKFLGVSLKTLTKNKKDSIKAIEFRTPNGTDHFYLWMNYIVFFSSFLTCIKNKTYDREYINYLFNEIVYDANHLENSVKIDERKAIEFANFIYKDEIEKECFYTQYFDKKIKIK